MNEFISVRVLRPCTITATRKYLAGELDAAPTFAIGDVVEVEVTQAQLLVGNGKAEYYAPEPETATAEPEAETATKPRARRRKASN